MAYEGQIRGSMNLNILADGLNQTANGVKPSASVIEATGNGLNPLEDGGSAIGTDAQANRYLCFGSHGDDGKIRSQPSKRRSVQRHHFFSDPFGPTLRKLCRPSKSTTSCASLRRSLASVMEKLSGGTCIAGPKCNVFGPPCPREPQVGPRR